MQQTVSQGVNSLRRIRFWHVLLVVLAAVFIVRLFYLQVIKHDYYQKAAFSDQLREYKIPAERGTIAAYNGSQIMPLVLNQKLYTLFADPVYVIDAHNTANEIQRVIGGKSNDIEQALKTSATRYVVLAKKLSSDQKNQLDKLKLKGIGTREADYRVYPDGPLAAQVLGFVNDDGVGNYGIEQALDSKLRGTPGQLKAITDAQGVPLVGNKNNIDTSPQPGQETVLTLDIGMQQMVEDALKAGLDAAHSLAGSALIIDINSGAVKAMANYPTYDPSQYYKVSDATVFNNASVAAPIETGSIMKTLTASAGIDQGVISKDTTYYDPGSWNIDGSTITNVEGGSVIGTHNIQYILNLSLNTGATWILMQMGGGQINQKARDAWHDYMVNHYHLGSATGIEQGYGEEAGGTIPDPDHGYALNLQYANTSFGQGMSATLLQMAAADAAVLNGGTYYLPSLVDGYIDPATGKEVKQAPKVWKTGIVKPSTGDALAQLMEGVIGNNYGLYKMRNPTQTPQYIIGGKTGTAQISQPGGGYYADKFNGTFMGFVGGDKPQYMVAIRVNDPHVNGYAGAGAAAPIFGQISASLLNNFNVTPKSQ